MQSARRQLLKHKLVQLPVKKWHSQTQSSGQETQTTEQVSQGQTSTQVAGQTSAQSTPSATEQARPRVLTNAAPEIATRAADSTIRINANRNTNITITASGTTPNVTIITGPNT